MTLSEEVIEYFKKRSWEVSVGDEPYRLCHFEITDKYLMKIWFGSDLEPRVPRVELYEWEGEAIFNGVIYTLDDLKNILSLTIDSIDDDGYVKSEKYLWK